MVAMAAVAATQSSTPMQGRSASVSVDSLDVAAASPSGAAQGAATPTQGAATTTQGAATPTQGAATTTQGATTPSQGATTTTPSGAADSLTPTRPVDQDDSVDEKVVKLEMGNLSATTSRENIDDEDEELEDDLETAKRRGNAWAAKKTVAQGMMDIALLTSNANQLRYLIMYGKNSSTYVISITLIAISILLQVAVGVVLIFKGKMHLKGEEKKAHANKLNNYVVVGVFLVTIINVFAASFSDVSSSASVGR